MDQLHDQAVNYYHVLNVEPRATRIEIREAYLRLKNTYAAGSAALYSLVSEDEAKGQLQRVEEAFRVLGDDLARREFDRSFFGAVGSAGDVMRAGASQGEAQFAMQVGRLLHARDFVASTWPGDVGVGLTPEEERDPTVVRTTRSTLPIIKLKANTVGSDELRARYGEMIATSDPADGDLFRRMREAAGVTEDEMQERIKVSIGYLRAIEGNRFERLPQAVYVKGFLRSYFRYLDVPEPEKLVTAFSSRLADWQSHKKT
jgi:hypothetical protein